MKSELAPVVEKIGEKFEYDDTVAEFVGGLTKFDYNYEFSDDGRIRDRGKEQELALKALGKKINKKFGEDSARGIYMDVMSVIMIKPPSGYFITPW